MRLWSLHPGQLDVEWRHLLSKLKRRDPARWARLRRSRPKAHPLLRLVRGGVAAWEKAE